MVPRQLISNCLKCYTRNYGALARSNVKVDPNVVLDIENEMYKPKQHPGIVPPKTISLPAHIEQAINQIVEDHPSKSLIVDSDTLSRHLKGRAVPIEHDQLKETTQNLYERVLVKEKQIEITNEKEEQQFKQKVTNKVNRLLKHKVYNWIPINYNNYNALLYLIARSTPEYAVLVKVFTEINMRDKNYKPRSVFDFGSGTGSVTWAAKLFWSDHIFEYFNVDISVDMNDLAQSILQGGRNSNTANLKGVFYRQFLPAHNIGYDLVVCAYSLLELPSCQTRMETALRLWNKTNKYLVIVEQGTTAGFKVINEIRDFILKLKDDTHVAHVFSPCPHEKPCPRFLTDDTPCNFEIGYKNLFGTDKVERERYSYIVLKRGHRNEEHANWPRVVRETLVRSKHSICRLCTKDGNLTEVIMTASKHGKSGYHCARATKWGDRLPVTLVDTVEQI